LWFEVEFAKRGKYFIGTYCLHLHDRLTEGSNVSASLVVVAVVVIIVVVVVVLAAAAVVV
jgi:hypothetical protein